MEIDFKFSSEEKRLLLRIARESVEAAVSGRRFTISVPESKRLRQKAGAFVTLHSRGDLRGCIGLIEGRLPLYETVAEMAEKSAIADPRFNRVTPDEIQDIDIEISVLSPLKKVGAPEDVAVGTHGVLIEMGFARGLLLPQVATENGWNREEFLRYVCLKAGLGQEDYKDPRAIMYVFTAEVFSEEGLRERSEREIAEGT